ncbi:MAG: YIP1 family protein [Rhodobacteraceae bacterium]|nr:YIP1 family protein [Paracoccaceae bacterium]
MTAKFIELVQITLLDPQKGGRILLSRGYPIGVVAELVVLVTALGALMTHFSVSMLDLHPGQPFAIAVGQLLALGVLALATFLIGRLFGGTGSLPQTVIMICWIQIVMLLVQLPIIIISALLSSGAGGAISDFLSILPLLLFFWMYVNFVKTLHAFKSAWKVLTGVVLTIFAAAFAAVSLLTLTILS